MPRLYAGPLIYLGPDVMEISLKNGKRYEDCVVTELKSGRVRVKIPDPRVSMKYLTFDSKTEYKDAFKRPGKKKKQKTTW